MIVSPNYMNLAKELRNLSDMFLHDREIKGIIFKPFEGDFFSHQDELALLSFADRQPFMQRLHQTPNFEEFGILSKVRAHQARRYNPYISIAVARNVAVGNWSSVDDKYAQELIVSNMVPEGGTVSGRKWHPRKLSFEEYYRVIIESWKDENFQEALNSALEARDKAKYDYWDRQFWIPARDRLESIAFTKMLHHGWVSDPRFWDYSIVIVDQDVDLGDVNAVRAVIKKFNGDSVIDFGGGK